MPVGAASIPSVYSKSDRNATMGAYGTLLTRQSFLNVNFA